MSAVFADTFYFYALLNPADESHAAARDFTASFSGTLFTTAWVFTEVGDGLAKVVNRPVFLRLVSELRTDPQTVIEPPGKTLFEEGIGLYSRRPDKDWLSPIASLSHSWSGKGLRKPLPATTTSSRPDSAQL